MKQTFYIIPYIWLFFGFPVLFLLSTIILLILKEWYPSIVCFVLMVITNLILIIGRKAIFAKIKITKDGISKIYKNEIIKFISWNMLVEVRALPKYYLYFLDKPFDNNTLLDYKTNICFWLTDKNLNCLLQYKENFQNKISDINILSDKHQEILLNSDLN